MLTRDEIGRIVRPSGRRVELAWDALSGALPTWLAIGTAPTDTNGLTFAGAGLDAYAQLAPASGGSATLVAPTLDLTAVEMFRMTVRGITLSHPSLVGYNIGAWDDGPLYGARLTLPTGSPYLTVGTFPISSSTNPIAPLTNYAPRENVEFQKPRTLSSIFYPQTRWNYALEGDSALAAYRHPKLDRGPVIPRVRCLAGAATGRWMRFQRVELEVVYR